MSFTAFDVVVIAVIGLSALLAMSRGLTREVLALATWVGAAIVALLLFPHLRPLTTDAVGPGAVADGLAAAAGFLVPLVALKLMARMLARAVEDSALGSADKLAGLGFGAVRGAALICIFYIAGAWAIAPERWPPWVAEARLLPTVRQGAAALERLVPESYRRHGSMAATSAREQLPGVPPKQEGPVGQQSYTPEERQRLERIMEQP